MKNKLTALALLAAATVSLVPTPARAHDNGLAIAGGLLGGLLIASAIHDSHQDAYAAPCAAPYAPRYDDRGNDGCWQNVSVLVWVPGCWVEERGYRGRGTQRYVAPHHETRINRVWVVADRGYRNDRSNRYNRDDRNGHGARDDRNDRREHNSRGRSHR